MQRFTMGAVYLIKSISRLICQANSNPCRRGFEILPGNAFTFLCKCTDERGKQGFCVLALFAFLVGHVTRVACLVIDKQPHTTGPAYSPELQFQTAWPPFHDDYQPTRIPNSCRYSYSVTKTVTYMIYHTMGPAYSPELQFQYWTSNCMASIP